MPKTSVLVENEMRRNGFVSVNAVTTQYGVSRAVIVDFVLQGKLTPKKPEAGANFFVKWSDCLEVFGKPAEFRRSGGHLALEEEPEQEEIMLDGMLTTDEVSDFYRDEAVKSAEERRKKQEAQKSAPRMIVRPAGE